MKSSSFSLGFLFLLATFHFVLAADQAATNNYDPHSPPSKGPWFEGWYTRIVLKDNSALACLVGSFCAPGLSCNRDQDLPGYISVLRQTNDDSPLEVVYEEYPENSSIFVKNQPVSENPDFSSPPDFEWRVADRLLFSNNAIVVSSPSLLLNVSISDPVYWNPSKPGEGPEGLVMDLPLQQHWFVYSLGSNAHVSYINKEDNVKLEIDGFAHQEKNWGSSFPSSWIWSQGTTQDNLHHFALSGGHVPIIGSAGVTAWLIGYRSPALSLSFRPQDIPTFFDPTIGACNGTFSFTVSHLSYKVIFDMSAPLSSFASLSIPTAGGWKKDGCVESYRSIVSVTVYRFGSLVEETVFKNAALEFGGGYMCK